MTYVNVFHKVLSLIPNLKLDINLVANKIIDIDIDLAIKKSLEENSSKLRKSPPAKTEENEIENAIRKSLEESSQKSQKFPVSSRSLVHPTMESDTDIDLAIKKKSAICATHLAVLASRI